MKEWVKAYILIAHRQGKKYAHMIKALNKIGVSVSRKEIIEVVLLDTIEKA